MGELTRINREILLDALPAELRARVLRQGFQTIQPPATKPGQNKAKELNECCDNFKNSVPDWLTKCGPC